MNFYRPAGAPGGVRRVRMIAYIRDGCALVSLRYWWDGAEAGSEQVERPAKDVADWLCSMQEPPFPAPGWSTAREVFVSLLRPAEKAWFTRRDAHG